MNRILKAISKVLILFGALLLLAYFLSGCAPPDANGFADYEKTPTYRHEMVYSDGWTHTVVMFEKDGYTCFYALNEGIWCDAPSQPQ